MNENQWDDKMDKVKILLQVKDIPERTTVTKLNGKKEYEISTDFAVYDENRQKLPVSLPEGCKFLLPMDGPSTGINIVGPDVYFLCQLTPGKALDLIEEIYDMEEEEYK